MKKGCFASLTALVLSFVLASTAQAQLMDKMGQAAGFAADGAIAYFGGKDVMLHRTGAPASPKRTADEFTNDGAHIWKDKDGRIVCIKVASGQVFLFKYDKSGAIRQVVEPNGSRLTRNNNGREWNRRNSDLKKTPVYGMVTLGFQHEIRYIADDGAQTVFNTNGYVVELDRFFGRDRVIKVTDSRGRATEFGYDAEGKPFSVKTADGFLLVRSDGDHWYRTLPGTPRDTSVPYTVVRDLDSGSVTISTPTNSTTYGLGGMLQHQK